MMAIVFFWTVSDQLLRSGYGHYSHDQLRKALCDHLHSLPDQEKDFLAEFISDRTFHEYVSNMRLNGTYADHIAVMYTSHVLSLPLRVLCSDNTVLSFGSENAAGFAIHVGYVSELNHYVSVCPKQQ